MHVPFICLRQQMVKWRQKYLVSTDGEIYQMRWSVKLINMPVSAQFIMI